MSQQRRMTTSEYVETAQKHFQNVRSIALRGHYDKVRSVSWNCSGDKLASCSADHTARIWNLMQPRQREIELKGHTASVEQVAWSPKDENIVATVSYDRTLRVWDIRTPGKSVFSFPTAGRNINVAWSPDGQHVAIGSEDDVVTLVNAKTGKGFLKKSSLFEVNEVSWNHEGDQFYMTTGQGTLAVLDWLSATRSVHVITAHASNCICIKFDPIGKYFATGAADAVVGIWDAHELVCVRTLNKLEQPVRSLSFSHDGQLLGSASEEPVIEIAYVETGETVCRLDTNGAVSGIAWHPSKLLLAYCTDANSESGCAVNVYGFPAGTPATS
eukprot:Colp12_sorted_trinity150504_noHs@18672